MLRTRFNNSAALTVLALLSTALATIALAGAAGTAVLDLAVSAAGVLDGAVGAGVLAGRGLVSDCGIRFGLTHGGAPGPHTDMDTTRIPTATSMVIPTRDTLLQTTIQRRPHSRTASTIKVIQMAIGSRRMGRA